MQGISDVDTIKLEQAIKAGDETLVLKEAKAFKDKIRKLDMLMNPLDYVKTHGYKQAKLLQNAIEKNNAEIEKIIAIKKGNRMTVDDADKQSANPHYTLGREYQVNCQTCAPAYMLRLRGFPIIAKGKMAGSLSEWISKSHSFDIWLNADGTSASGTLYSDFMVKNGYKRMSPPRYKDFFCNHVVRMESTL